MPAIAGNPNGNSPVADRTARQTTGVIFQINNAKPYVSVASLPLNDNYKRGYKIRIFWKKIWSEIGTQTKNDNLNYRIDPTFRNTNRLFVISFRNGDNDPTRDSFDQY